MKSKCLRDKRRQRFYFQTVKMLRKWYDENYMHTTMGSGYSSCPATVLPLDNAGKVGFLMAVNIGIKRRLQSQVHCVVGRPQQAQ